MQDLQSYQYYDPSPQPTPEPWWKRKRTWRMVALLAVFAVVLAFAVIAAVNVVKNKRIANQDADLMGQADAMTSQMAAECDTADTTCLERARADAARSLGLTDACRELEGSALTDCVKLIAIDKQNPALCDVLSGGDRESCADTPYSLKAQADMNLALCDEITSTLIMAACSAQVTADLVAAGRCEEAGVEQSECDASVELETAIASNDPAACEAIDDSFKEVCLKAQSQADVDDDGLVANDEEAFGTSEGVTDTDADGLTDGDEVHLYATDPANPDTDGDTFSDGTEIEGGYNPLE